MGYLENKETGKIELHFEKSEYMALSEDQKKSIKSNFLFSRAAGAWVSRCKWPNLYRPIQVAKDLGLEDEGTTGERLTFAEQQERQAERAERRADRYEAKAEKAEERAHTYRKPIEDMRGDIAFFTQPNINTSSGRAFTNKRNRMWASWEKGFEEFRKSEYYKERAEMVRNSAENKPSKDFCQRRIDDANKAIRAQQRYLKQYDEILQNAETEERKEQVSGWIEKALEIIQANIEKAAYYDAIMQEQGGVEFSKDNLKKGDLIKVARWGTVRFLKGGPKNFTYEFLSKALTYADGTPMQGKAAYAEIIERMTLNEND